MVWREHGTGKATLRLRDAGGDCDSVEVLVGWLAGSHVPVKMAARLAAKYEASLRSRPLLTKAATGLTLSSTGDLLAQYAEAHNAGEAFLDRYNPRRTAVFGGFGSLWTGPVNHFYLPRLIAMFPDPSKTAVAGAAVSRAASWAATAKRVAFQQLVFNPFVFMPTFFTVYGVGMGLTLAELETKFRREYANAMVECWRVWVPTTLVVFRLPERYQSVTMAVVSLAWNARLSWLSSETKTSAVNHSGGSHAVVAATSATPRS